jgi:chloramphenicol 3-O phosphotransferase
VTGRVVVLNGSSSAGKSTLGRALQEKLLPEVWLLLGVDTFITALPWGLDGTAEGHVINEDGSIDLGPVWRAERARWRAAVASLARSGSNVILDEVFTEGSEDQARWRTDLVDLEVTWVGVHCDVEELDRRERARGDRQMGMARHQAAQVHVGVAYDVEVDTTSAPPDDVAAQLASQVG